MRITVGSAVIFLGAAAAVFAAPVTDPTDDALGAMMSSQEGVTSYLMRRFGLLTNTLSFSSQINPDSFTYSLTPGSLFNAFPVTLNATGTRVGAAQWSVSGTGVLIDPPMDIDFTDLLVFTFPLPKIDDGLPDDQDWDGSSGAWDWHGHKTWSVNPLDEGEIVSSGYIVYSKNNAFQTIRPAEDDFRRRFIDLDGSWHTALTGTFDNGLNARLVADGVFAANGSGSFTVSATPVPEPGFGPAMLFILVGGGAVLRAGRASRSPIRAEC